MLNYIGNIETIVRAWLVRHVARDETGASLVEYALLLALVAVVAIGALIYLGGSTGNTLQNVANNVANP